jgi:hypothetical protein
MTLFPPTSHTQAMLSDWARLAEQRRWDDLELAVTQYKSLHPPRVMCPCREQHPLIHSCGQTLWVLWCDEPDAESFAIFFDCKEDEHTHCPTCGQELNIDDLREAHAEVLDGPGVNPSSEPTDKPIQE